MTREQMMKKATEEAYHDIAEDVVEHVRNFLEDVISEYRFIDFTDEVFQFINKEQFEENNEHIVYDIVKPAEEEITARIRKALLYDKF